MYEKRHNFCLLKNPSKNKKQQPLESEDVGHRSEVGLKKKKKKTKQEWLKKSVTAESVCYLCMSVCGQ